MEKTLSIIIPTFNMERYLDYCLSSLVVDDRSLMERLEVLVVNDGSKDKSSEIAHGFEELFPQTFRVIDKENGNYGSCVNRGLKEAKGRYIKVLDADDSFDTRYFEEYLRFLSTKDVDLVLSSFDVVNETREVTKAVRFPYEENVVHRFSEVVDSKSFELMEMHAVTYKRDNVVGLGYTQTEGISFTDQQWIFYPMTAVNCVCVFGKPVYQYLVGREGQTMDPVVQVRQKTHLIQCIYGMVEMYTKCKNSISADHLSYLHARLRPLLKGIYLFYFSNREYNKNNELGEFDEQIKRLDKELYCYIGSSEVSSIAGFEYIAFWRKIYKKHTVITWFYYVVITILLKLKK